MTRAALYILCAVLALTACRTPASTSEHHASTGTDTLHVFRNRLDSVYLHDSVFVASKGDTIIKERYRTHTRYIVRTDTLYRARTDTLRIREQRVIKERYTPRPIRWLAMLGGASLLGWILYAAFRFKFFKVKRLSSFF